MRQAHRPDDDRPEGLRDLVLAAIAFGFTVLFLILFAVSGSAPS